MTWGSIPTDLLSQATFYAWACFLWAMAEVARLVTQGPDS